MPKKLKLSPEAQLCLDHPDFAELFAQEYWEWVMYGMFLGLLSEDVTTGRDPGLFIALEGELKWLETQCEDGQMVARAFAVKVFQPNYPSKHPYLFI